MIGALIKKITMNLQSDFALKIELLDDSGTSLLGLLTNHSIIVEDLI